METIKHKSFTDNLDGIKKVSDIYSGDENIRFDNRHPIYKTLMKLEFEDVLRGFTKK